MASFSGKLDSRCMDNSSLVFGLVVLASFLVSALAVGGAGAAIWGLANYKTNTPSRGDYWVCGVLFSASVLLVLGSLPAGWLAANHQRLRWPLMAPFSLLAALVTVRFATGWWHDFRYRSRTHRSR